MPPTTTMKRIAGELGVSITTVSKVLNNREDIGHATRARVLAKVAELGYQPNAVARSLTLRRTHTLGVVIPDLMHSFFVEIVAGLETLASAREYGLLAANIFGLHDYDKNVKKGTGDFTLEPGKTVTFRYRVVIHTGDAKGAKLDDKFREYAGEVAAAIAAESSVDTLHRIIHIDPPPVTTYTPAAPPQLEQIIGKCLFKDPGLRYQSMHDLLLDLRTAQQQLEASPRLKSRNRVSLAHGSGARGPSIILITVAMVI